MVQAQTQGDRLLRTMASRIHRPLRDRGSSTPVPFCEAGIAVPTVMLLVIGSDFLFMFGANMSKFLVAQVFPTDERDAMAALTITLGPEKF